MKIKKILAAISVTALALVTSMPSNYALAARGDEFIALPCAVSMARNDEGIAIFCWDGKCANGSTEQYCSWVIVQKDNFEKTFIKMEDREYLASHSFQVIKRSDFESRTFTILESDSEISVKGEKLLKARHGVDVMSSLFKRKIQELQKSATPQSEKAILAVQTLMRDVEATKNAQSSPVVATSEDSASVSFGAEADTRVSSDSEPDSVSCSSPVSDDYSKVNELSIPGIVVHYYPGWVPRTSWVGFLIDDVEEFTKWCIINGLDSDDIKLAVSCQNLWMSTPWSLMRFLDSQVTDLPKIISDKLIAIVEKHNTDQAGFSLGSMFSRATKTNFGYAINTSERYTQSVKDNLFLLGMLTDDEIDAIKDAPKNYGTRTILEIKKIIGYKK